MYRPMISILAAAFVTGVLAANPAWAGYKEGVAAYKAKNYELALKEFRKAADGGHAGAQHRLGFMYEKGRGMRTNEETARKWYRLSAEQGDARGQRGLGRLLRKGRGGPQDLVEAYKWSTLALEKRPNEKLEHWRGWIEKRLTWDEIAEAKKRTREWRERHPIQTETLPNVEASSAYQWPAFQAGLRTGSSNSPVKAKPPTLSLAPAAVGTSADRAKFGGVWEGWMCRHRSADVKLAVTKVTNEGAEVEYASGSERFGAYDHTMSTRFDGDVLRGEFPDEAELILGMRPDRHMNVKFDRPGRNWCTGIMQRTQAPPES